MILLNAAQLDALKELINLGVGQSAGILNQMLDVHVQLQVPFVDVLPSTRVVQALEHQLGGDPVAMVQLGFSGPFSGMAHLVFPSTSGAKLVSAMLREDVAYVDDLDAIKAGTLSEVGNVVLNGVMGRISNLLGQHLQYSFPVYAEDCLRHLMAVNPLRERSTTLLAQTRFSLSQLCITGDIILLFEVGSFEALLAVLDQCLAINND